MSPPPTEDGAAAVERCAARQNVPEPPEAHANVVGLDPIADRQWIADKMRSQECLPDLPRVFLTEDGA